MKNSKIKVLCKCPVSHESLTHKIVAFNSRPCLLQLLPWSLNGDFLLLHLLL